MNGEGFEENKAAEVVENSVKLLIGKGNLIEVELKANEKPIKAILDTGACVSVASASLARSIGWKIDDKTVNLFGANSMPLKCIGSTLIKLELTLNHTMKATNYGVAVVENLATPFLIGLKLMKLRKICVDTTDNTVKFRKETKTSGVRVANDQIIPPKTQKIIEGRANTIGTIITVPFQFNNEILIANSVGNVEQNRTLVLIVNNNKQELSLTKGEQIATF